MVFSTRFRARNPILVFALIGVLLLAGVFIRGAIVNAAGTSLQPVTKGILTPSTTIIPPDAPANVPRGVRRIHTGNAQTSRIPTPAGSQLAGNAGALLQNFNGTSSLDSEKTNFTFNNRIGVWAMTNRQAVSQGGIPTLSHIVITSEPYGVPPPAVQKGSSSTLDSGDDRMQQVQYINGNLWGELTTAVTIPNDNTERAGAAWFEVNPHLNGQVIGGAAILKQGYVTLKGNYLIYPAIQASSTGTAAMIMTLSGKNFFPSVVYTVLQAGQTTFGPIQVAAFGTGPYYHKSTRWGDYSWAILDPDGNSFWMATEYIPPRSSQTTDGKQNWGTRVIEVSA